MRQRWWAAALVVTALGCGRESAPPTARDAQAKLADAVAPAVKGPKLQVEETFNAGQVQQGTKIEHTFVVKNVGSDVLKLLEAKAS